MNKLVRLNKFGSVSFTVKSFHSVSSRHMYLEKIVKRIILEFKNNDRIFLTDDIKNVFRQFYQVKHININLSDKSLHLCSEIDNFDLCVLKMSELKTAIGFRRSRTNNLILINDEILDSSQVLQVAAQTIPKLIIDNNFVFKYEPILNRLRQVENFESHLDSNYKLMDSIVSKNAKNLLQECF